MNDLTRVTYIVSGRTLGGAERQLLYLLEKLPRHEFAPTVITVLGALSTQRRGDIDIAPSLASLDVPHVALDRLRFPDFIGLLTLRSALKASRPDIVQPLGIRADIAARLLLLGHPACVISSIRGPERQRPSFVCRLDGLTASLVSQYTSNSTRAAAEYGRRAGIPHDRIRTIPNGIDADAISSTISPQARERIRGEFGIASDCILYLCVANLHEAKGHDQLLQAFVRLEDSEARLLLVGLDRTNGRICGLAEKLGIANRVIFAGPRSDVPDILAASDIFVLASRWEGLSNSLMEAMACSLPCVATSVGGTPELLDSESGVLVPPDDHLALSLAMDCLAHDESRRSQMGAAAARRIRSHFSLEALVYATVETYRSASARARGRGSKRA